MKYVIHFKLIFYLIAVNKSKNMSSSKVRTCNYFLKENCFDFILKENKCKNID